MKIRKSVAAVTLAGAALFVATGCSESTDTVDEATSAVSTAVESAASQVETAASDAVDEVTGLSNDDAQETLRQAIDPNTSSEELDQVIDVTNPPPNRPRWLSPRAPPPRDTPRTRSR